MEDSNMQPANMTDVGIDRVETLKFGITNKAIETSLREAYNTSSVSIWDQKDFQKIVLETLDNAVDPLEFYDRLGRERDAKREELEVRFKEMGYAVIQKRSPSASDDDESKKWAFLRHLFKHRSFDSLVKTLAAVMPGTNDFIFSPDPDLMGHPEPRTRPPPTKVFERKDLPDSVRTVTPPASPALSTSPPPPMTPSQTPIDHGQSSTHFELFDDMEGTFDPVEETVWAAEVAKGEGGWVDAGWYGWGLNDDFL